MKTSRQLLIATAALLAFSTVSLANNPVMLQRDLAVQASHVAAPASAKLGICEAVVATPVAQDAAAPLNIAAGQHTAGLLDKLGYLWPSGYLWTNGYLWGNS